MARCAVHGDFLHEQANETDHDTCGFGRTFDGGEHRCATRHARRSAPDGRRDYFGCYDIENAKTGYRLYIDAVDAAAKKGVANPDLAGVAVVERFVWEHEFDHSNHNKPDFYTDTCQTMKPFVKKDNAYVVKETAEWDGVGQLACLGLAMDFSTNTKRPLLDHPVHAANTLTLKPRDVSTPRTPGARHEAMGVG